MNTVGIKERLRVQRPYLIIFIIGLILLISVLVRLPAVGEIPVWSDEAFTLILSSYSPSKIVFHTTQDVHPPLYYLVLHYWMVVFGNGLFATRSLSVMAGSLSVMLGIWLLLLISTRRAAVLGGVILALLPIAVRYSQEVRMYALLGLFMLGATIAFVYWLKNPRINLALAMYIVLAAAGLYTHYFAAVSLVSYWVYLLNLMCRRDAPYRYLSTKAWWLANMLIVLIFTPWIPSLMHQLAFSGFNWIKRPDINTVVSAMWMFVNYSDGLNFPAWVFVSLPILMFMVALAVVMHDSSPNKYNYLVVIYTWFPLFLIVVVSFFCPLFVVRYFMFAALGLPMIFALALDTYWGRGKFICCICMMLIISVEGGGIYNVHRVGHVVYQEVNSMDVVSAQLNARAGIQDEVLITNEFLYFPFVYYNTTGVTPKLYTPPNADGTLSRPDGTSIWTLVQTKADEIFVENMDRLKSKSGRIWLLGEYKGESQITVFPQNWRLISTFIVGDTQLQLFEMGSSDAQPNSSTVQEIESGMLSPDSANLP
ncbi:MAG: glycosyltransferase family 39 protein [Pseudomonas sp.]